MTRRYSRGGYAGLVERRTSRQTGRVVFLLQAAQAGIEDDPVTPWATLCEEHSGVVCHRTLAEARSALADPLGWCEACAFIAREDWEGLARWAATGSYDRDGRYSYPEGDAAIAAARVEGGA